MMLSMKKVWDKYAIDRNAEGFSEPNKSIKVWGINPITKEVSKTKIKRLLRQKYKRLLKVSLDIGDSIIVDEYHQFVLFDNLDKTFFAKELKIGQVLPVLDNNHNLIPSNIISIEETKSVDNYVYDIELEENHLFPISSGIITHNCCRLRNDTGKMKEFFNSLGSSSNVKIGSHRVVTINMPRLAKNSDNLDDFISKLSKKMEICRTILKFHRDLLQKEIDLGILPLYSLNFMELEKQFSTVGLIGFYEAMDILGLNILEDSNLKYAKQVINFMNDRNEQFSQEDKCLYNLEQIPGEACAIKLAQKDNLLYGMDYKMYSNQVCPLVKNVPLTKRIKLQGVFDASMSGGSVLHINIAEKITSTEMLLTLMNYAVENNVVYFACNYNISQCSNKHLTVGKVNTCSICGEPIVENYLRVVGFLTPVSSWKEERRGKIDYESRVFY